MTRLLFGYSGIFTPSYQLTLKPFPDILKTEPHHIQFRICACVCVWARVCLRTRWCFAGMREMAWIQSDPAENCQRRRVPLQTIIPPVTKNQSVESVVSYPFIYQKKKKKSCKHNFFYGWPLYITAWRLMASRAINLPQSSAQLFICHSVIFLPLSPHLCQGFWFNHPKNTLFPIFPFQNATVFFRR